MTKTTALAKRKSVWSENVPMKVIEKAKTVPVVGYPHFSTLIWGIPFSGRPLPPRIMLSFHAVSPPMNYNMVQYHTHGMNIDAARNHFAERAREHKAKYVFFWDEDVDMPPQTLRELIFMAEHHPEAAVIGGIYCLKVDRPEPLVFNGAGQGPYWDWKIGEIFPVQAIGMGCTLIRTAVFDDIPKPWFQTVDDQMGYLDNIHFGESWTEDLYFCKKVMDTKKWKILAHGQLLPAHIDLSTGNEYRLPADSKPMREITARLGQKKILDIASGDMPMKTNEGRVFTLDIREEVNPDYRCDFRRLPFATGEFDIVHSAHALEHVGRDEVGKVLDEWTRVVAPDGELRLNIPNIKWAAERIMQGIVDRDVMNVLYGDQLHGENYHKNGFTPETLKALLKERGFIPHFEKHIGYNIILCARRDNGVDRQRNRNGKANRSHIRAKRR